MTKSSLEGRWSLLSALGCEFVFANGVFDGGSERFLIAGRFNQAPFTGIGEEAAFEEDAWIFEASDDGIASASDSSVKKLSCSDNG